MTNLMYFILVKFKILPSRFYALSENEQAFVLASALTYARDIRKANDKARRR